ncbi:MAG: DNA cytosine methyltransferase [Bacilli bacterium]
MVIILMHVKNPHGLNLHPKLPRFLIPRELAALQSFPDSFVFMSAKKNGNLFKLETRYHPY